jgi:glycosyltransferase involved in cell wall biosynthesis
MLLSAWRRQEVKKGEITPSVSLIITAYNEEKQIGGKLDNTFALDYPADKLEIIVASDCSNDGTDDIVRSHATRGIKLARAPERKGKENAQRLAVEQATGEILVFSDTATILKPDGIRQIVQNFHDPTVGCVSSVDRFIDAGGRVSGEGAYVRYEMWLRALETRTNSLVGLSGSFFAARPEVCRPWASDLQSDFNTLLNAIKKGLRGVSDPNSVGYYRNIADENKEFNRKVRTVTRGIGVLMRNLSLMNPFRHSLFAWQLFSHKFCRWVVPFLLIIAAVFNLLLLPYGQVYGLLFLGQALFYLLAWGGRGGSLPGLLRIPFYFVNVNLAILMAWYRYATGERMTTWDPSKR